MMSLFGIKDRARWGPESMARLLLYARMTSRRVSKLLRSLYFPSEAVAEKIPFKHVHVFRSGHRGVQKLTEAPAKDSQGRCQRMHAARGGGAGKQCPLVSFIYVTSRLKLFLLKLRPHHVYCFERFRCFDRQVLIIDPSQAFPRLISRSSGAKLPKWSGVSVGTMITSCHGKPPTRWLIGRNRGHGFGLSSPCGSSR